MAGLMHLKWLIVCICYGFVMPFANAHIAGASNINVIISDGSVTIKQRLPLSMINEVTSSTTKDKQQLINAYRQQMPVSSAGKPCSVKVGKGENTKLDEQGWVDVVFSYACVGSMSPLTVEFDWLLKTKANHHLDVIIKLDQKSKHVLIEKRRPYFSIDVPKIRRLLANQ